MLRNVKQRSDFSLGNWHCYNDDSAGAWSAVLLRKATHPSWLVIVAGERRVWMTSPGSNSRAKGETIAGVRRNVSASKYLWRRGSAGNESQYATLEKSLAVARCDAMECGLSYQYPALGCGKT